MQFMRGRFDLAAPRIRYRVERACISFGSSVSLILQPANTSIPINWNLATRWDMNRRDMSWKRRKRKKLDAWLGILEMYDFFRKYLKRNEYYFSCLVDRQKIKFRVVRMLRKGEWRINKYFKQFDTLILVKIKFQENSRNRKIFRTFINVCSYTASYVSSNVCLKRYHARSLFPRKTNTSRNLANQPAYQSRNRYSISHEMSQ